MECNPSTIFFGKSFNSTCARLWEMDLDKVIVMLRSMPVLDSASDRKLNGDIGPTNIYNV